MKLSHFLGRKDCCESISTGCHSVRRHEVWKYGSKPLNPLTGPFQRHLFIMVQIGAVAFRRDGLISIADPDDALLIDSGEGEIEFFESDSCVKATILEFDERQLPTCSAHLPSWNPLRLTQELSERRALSFLISGANWVRASI